MRQEERIEFLIRALAGESENRIPMMPEFGDRKALLRAMMNMRPPLPIPEEVRKVQDAYLEQETREREPLKADQLSSVKDQYGAAFEFADRICLWQGDIIRLTADAIVNAANSALLGCFVPLHRCIDNAIHSAAGMELREACHQYMEEQRKIYGDNYEEPTGSAVITPGYCLPCRYVLHTVGPIVGYELTERHRTDLKNCYLSCLRLAADRGLNSIAFCCISTGEFHFPNEEAAAIAVETVREFMKEHEEWGGQVIFNVFKDYDLEIYERIFRNLKNE